MDLTNPMLARITVKDASDAAVPLYYQGLRMKKRRSVGFEPGPPHQKTAILT